MKKGLLSALTAISGHSVNVVRGERMVVIPQPLDSGQLERLASRGFHLSPSGSTPDGQYAYRLPAASRRNNNASAPSHRGKVKDDCFRRPATHRR